MEPFIVTLARDTKHMRLASNAAIHIVDKSMLAVWARGLFAYLGVQRLVSSDVAHSVAAGEAGLGQAAFHLAFRDTSQL